MQLIILIQKLKQIYRYEFAANHFKTPTGLTTEYAIFVYMWQALPRIISQA